MSVQDWSATADDNASIDGINIAEHCPAKNLNDAIRAVMAGVKGRDGETVHLEGAETITGAKTFSETISGSIDGNAATATKATQDAEGNVISDTYAVDSDVLHKSGAETITGAKTFSETISGSIDGNAATATKATQDAEGNVISDTYAVDSDVLHKSGAETIGGKKTFSSGITSTVNSDVLVHESGELNRLRQPTWDVLRFLGLVKDTNGAKFCGVAAQQIKATGSVAVALYAYRPGDTDTTAASLRVVYPAKTAVDGVVTEAGEPYATAPATPTTPPLSNTVVTTGWLASADSNVVHRTGDETIGGVKTFTETVNVESGYIAHRDDPTGFLFLRSGNNSSDGAMLHLFGRSHVDSAGSFHLRASDKSSSTSDGSLVSLIGKPDGTLTWGGKEVERIDSSGSGWVRYVSGLQFCWGVKTITGVGFTGSFTLPKPFTNVFSACATQGSTAMITPYAKATQTAVQIIVGGTFPSNVTKIDIEWMVVGLWK